MQKYEKVFVNSQKMSTFAPAFCKNNIYKQFKDK